MYRTADEVVLPEYFPVVTLPEGSIPIKELAQEGCDDPKFIAAYNYLLSRGDEFIDAYDFYWCPNDENCSLSQRIIIPVTFKNRIVGWTGRAINNDIPDRYYAQHPSDILFNSEILNDPHRKYLPVMEGAIDAIAVSGVGTFGARLSKKQLKWIQNSGKVPVLVADRDSSGIRNIDTAMKLGWAVSFPRLASRGWWEADVKDAAEAAKRYGRLYTVQSILQNIVTDPFQIEVLAKMTV